MDEAFQKKLLLHMLESVFPLLRGQFELRRIFYPQFYQQAVHKLRAFAHRLSTALLFGALCASG
ncbi:hypothetical protein ACQR35_13760 [Pseudarthrobacter sp. J1738]|uniref:hypothetical protein n=1 Tax=unclassified Pseudarthrobacter TaxID=2647000 RepID=UPI003D270982